MAAKVFGRKSLTDRNSTFESDAALFAAIVANSTDAIISKSLDGVVETWNPAAEKLFGWTSGEIIGASISRIIPESRVHEETAILERIRAGETVPRFRTERVSKSGELIPISVTVSPVRAADGTVTGASKIANDLREQNRLVSDLRQQPTGGARAYQPDHLHRSKSTPFRVHIEFRLATGRQQSP